VSERAPCAQRQRHRPFSGRFTHLCKREDEVPVERRDAIRVHLERPALGVGVCGGGGASMRPPYYNGRIWNILFIGPAPRLWTAEIVINSPVNIAVYKKMN
jgi:hypothetical protein